MNPLPFLLGYAEMLIIEPFPAEAKAAWDTQTGLGVIERSQPSWHHIGPFSETEVAHGATERIDFNVLGTTPDTARISKRYSLHTAAEASGATQIDMSGNGDFEFDRKEGAIKSQTMKYEIRLSVKNVNLTIPFTARSTSACSVRPRRPSIRGRSRRTLPPPPRPPGPSRSRRASGPNCSRT